MASYEAVDFYGLEDLLTEEERMVRDAVRSWVDDRIIPTIGEHYRKGTFPVELIPEMGELGFFGPTIPTEYGGGGMGPVAYGLICRELDRGDSGFRSFASVQSSLSMFPIWTWGSEEQKRRWLPEMAAGRAVGCFGLTEPDAGSDPGAMKTRARRDGEEYVLNGAKMWITNGSIADIAVVWARDEEGQVGGFLVEKGTPGFSAPEMRGKISLRASVTSELVLDDCRIPVANRLPGAKGLKSPLHCLTQARFGIAWGVVGVASACYDEVLKYVHSRTAFGKPLAGRQLIQRKLVIMLTEITKAQLMVLQLGRLKETGKAQFDQVSMAKRNNVEWALQIARMARDMLGANGISLEYGVGRHMCNLETVSTYEGTHDIHTLILGQSITGIPAFD
jgi:glutaryl-CoA dehydrogenase